MADSGCFSDDMLRAYHDGAVPAEVALSVTSHLQGCTTCLERLQSLDTMTDTLVVALRRQRLVEGPAPDPLLDQAIANVLDGAFVLTKESPSELSPGAMLNEYQLIEKLGSGGMGAVYRARHVRLDKEVALKVVQPHWRQDPHIVERFQREMKAIGKLRDPHIVLATDAGEAAGVLYLVMELEHGVDLHDYVGQRGPLPVAEACEYIRQAALGLHAAHEAGLVHRDVKPSNLFRTNDGQIKLLDLGLARLLDDVALQPEGRGQESAVGQETAVESPKTEHAEQRPDGRRSDVGRHGRVTATQGQMGTDDYMAPEQWQDAHRVDARGDLYALGCTLHFLLTGDAPFESPEWKTREQKRDAHLTAAPPEVRKRRSEVPSRVESLVQRLLAKDPEQRPASAADVAAVLADYARPRRRAWIALALGAALAASIGLAVILPGWRGRPEEPGDGQANGAAPGAEPAAFTGPPLGQIPMTEEKAKALQHQWADYLGVPTTIVLDNDLGVELIPPGELNLGRDSNARITKAYYLGRHEVTVKQFRGFVDDAKYRTSIEVNGQGGHLSERHERGYASKPAPGVVWQRPGVETGDEHPVTQVSWDDAQAFCAWLSKRSGKTCRLPTEAEWRWAARGADSRQFADAPGKLGDKAERKPGPAYGWVHANSKGHPWPVGKLLPNAWGLYDVLGNVREWCNDWHGDRGLGMRVDPKGPSAGQGRLLMGAFYQTNASLEYYWGLLPSLGCSDAGFRILCEVSSPKIAALPNPAPAVEKKPEVVLVKVPPNPGGLPMTAAEAKDLQKAWADYSERKIVTTNSLGMKMTLVPPGRFAVGASMVVLTKPFEVSATEVTRAQFRVFALDANYQTQAESSGLGGILYANPPPLGVKRRLDFIWAHPGYAGAGDVDPVVHVTWHDAVAFCEWLSRREKKNYRLPTIAQWQWAARAGSAGKFPFGDDAAQLSDYAWHRGNADHRPQPVARKLANAWGLHDVLGNVAELARDGPRSWPIGLTRDPEIPLDSKSRAILGGYYLTDHLHEQGRGVSCVAVSSILANEPSTIVGFRVVCETVMSSAKE